MRSAIAALLASGAVATHYEDPRNGCGSDEQAIKVQGISGDFCSPKCQGTTCPTDAPSSSDAKAQCALKSPTGDQFCALLCTPGSNAACPDGATCQPIQGVGVCTYPSAGLATDVVHPAVFVATDGVHPERRAQIEEIKNTPGILWTAAVYERFASEAPGASKHLMGVKGNWSADIAAAIARGEVERFQPTLAADQIPDHFDSATNWPKCAKIIGDIRDQSDCGCCWAFAGAEAASDRMCIATDAKLMLPISAQDVCFSASDDGCKGGDITTPWFYVALTGAVTGGQYNGTGPFGKGFCSDFSLPHCHHGHGPQGKDPYPATGKPGCTSQSSPEAPSHCDSDAEAPHNEYRFDKYSYSSRQTPVLCADGPAAIKEAIMAGGPVETAFTVYSDFENYAGGIYHQVSKQVLGGHAVKIVGWGVENGTKYWKIANSWNPYWGENGYFRIKEGECGIDDETIFSPAGATWGKFNKTEVVV